jgi:two-component system response regulator
VAPESAAALGMTASIFWLLVPGFPLFDFRLSTFRLLLEATMDQRVILLVEDNADDEALTLRALKGHNILNPVVVARDGSEALDYLFARGAHVRRNPLELPAVMLLDLRLPKLDGLEVLKQVRASDITRLLPVVILTSSHEEQDLLSGYVLGCNSYIRKPVDFEQFRSTVQQMGLYWLVVNQPPPPSPVSTKQGMQADKGSGTAKNQQADQERAAGVGAATPLPL